MTIYQNCEISENIAPASNSPFLAFCLLNETSVAAKLIGIDENFLKLQQATKTTRFESRSAHGYFSVCIVKESVFNADAQVDIYLSKDHFILMHSEAFPITNFLQKIQTQDYSSPESALLLFLQYLTEKDTNYLDDFEEEIIELEDTVIVSAPKNLVSKISSCRKKLISLKRYYESLFDAIEDMMENQTSFLSSQNLQLLQLILNRIERLERAVLNLRDYVTQVREAYQNQIDISLNKTMKFFTVITSIFLPLTLIVGWFGMNLMMPEFSMPYAYPAVICLCLIITVGSIIYFKKSKWF